MATLTTPKFLFPYPDGTERIMDGDDAIGALAMAVENTIAATRVQHGAIMVNASAGSVALTFPKPFAAEPAVLVTPVYNGSSFYICNPAPVAFTGATLHIRDHAGAIPAVAVWLKWLAVGPLPAGALLADDDDPGIEALPAPDAEPRAALSTEPES